MKDATRLLGPWSRPGKFLCGILVVQTAGCALEEIRSKTSMGPQFRHRESDDTDAVRWSVKQGFDFKWNNDVTTGISYVRRDTDDGNGNHDNGLLLSISFPIWKDEPKPKATKKSLKALEARVAELEALVGSSNCLLSGCRMPGKTSNWNISDGNGV